MSAAAGAVPSPHKFRFAGTLKEISTDKTSIVLKFAPDQEYTSSYKKGKEAVITYAILQPDDDKDIGYVFKYSDDVRLVVSRATPCHHLTVNLHCLLELDTTLGSGLCDITFSDVEECSTATSSVSQFSIISVRTL